MRALALAFVLVLAVAASAVAHELTLSAAISMKEAVEQIGRQFVAGHPGTTLRFNFGSSGELQKQIEAGAPIDLFLSAAARQMDELERRGLVVARSRRVFARNVLVAIKPLNSPLDLAKPADLLAARVRRVVVGNPKTVPVGQYAEESLRSAGLWERIQPKLVFAENVRQALDYVARGEVEAGFVYTTDFAARTERVREAFRPGEDTYRPVIYPAAVVKASKYPAVAQAFVEGLLSRDARGVLQRLGFQPSVRTP